MRAPGHHRQRQGFSQVSGEEHSSTGRTPASFSGDANSMSNALYVTMAPRYEDREVRRVQQEREHPDAFTRYEINEHLKVESIFRIRVQTIGSILRTPYRSAPASRIQSSPITH